MNFFSTNFHQKFNFPTLLGISIVAGIGILLILLQGTNAISSTSSNNKNQSFSSSLVNDNSGQLIPIAADRIRDEPESVWVEFIQLASDYKPLNLGQGFPDFSAPPYLIEALHNATNDSKNPEKFINNQYTRSFGQPRLIKALMKYYNEFRDFKKLTNPNEQILITVGAYEALFTSIMAFVSPGDEVLIIEPAFDAYKPMVEMALGKAVFIPLRLSEKYTTTTLNEKVTEKFLLNSSMFEINLNELKDKITKKTKVLILNTPNNPLGKIYTRSELRALANVCKEHNLLVISDEVYEQIYYNDDNNNNNQTHLSIAQMPGMWDRTITIGSAGKTFSVTGWKIGWAFGPKHLIKYLQLIHQTSIYTVATPLQEAIAQAFENEMSILDNNLINRKSYWQLLREDLFIKREKIVKLLLKANLKPIIPQGGYFILVDFSNLAKNFKNNYEIDGFVFGKPNTNDYKFVRWLAMKKNLLGIPASAFYSNLNKPLAENLVRFCFIKQNSTLDKLESLIERNFL